MPSEHAVGLGGQGHEGRDHKGTPGQKLDSAIKVGKDQADDVEAAAKTSAKAAKNAVDDLVDDVTDASANGRGGA